MNGIDRHNYNEFISQGNKGVYICKVCNNSTELDYSFSYKGINLLCSTCCSRVANILGMTVGETIGKLQEVGSKII